MISGPVCKLCESKLSCDEIGIYKKTVNRGATSYLCIECLAKEFGCTTDVLRERIEFFRESGCTLFTPKS